MRIERTPATVALLQYPGSSTTLRRLARLPVLHLAGLILLIFLAYSPAWFGGFVWDDDSYITNNPLLVAGDGLQRIWFSLSAPSQYFPLTYTVLRWEHGLFGLTTVGYHLINILLHACNALLVWRLFCRLRLPAALVSAAVFALHPVQVESVAWMTELKNVLMGFFFLWTLLAWNRFLDSGKNRWSFYAGSLLLYAFALSAKSTACTLPVALFVILWLRRERFRLRRGLQMAPFAGMALAMGLVAMWWERYHQGTHGALFDLGFIKRLLVASHALWFYLGKLIWPARLVFIYPQWTIRANDIFAYGWMIGILLAAAVILKTPNKIRRALGQAILFYAGTLAPVLGFIMLYTFRYTYVADHYQYLACLGPIALATGLLEVAARHFGRVAVSCGAMAIIAILAGLTWRQSHDFQSSEALWRATIAKNPSCWMGFNNLGIDLYSKGRFDDAIAQYRRSLDLHADYAEAHYNLANALLAKGNQSGALDEARAAVQLDPRDPDAHVSLGNALSSAGRLTEAIQEYSLACDINPEDADAHYNLGNALQQSGDVASAASRYQTALRLNPQMIEAHVNLGRLLWGEGRQRDAITEFETAVQFDPHSNLARLNLAWALASASDRTLRNGARATALCRNAEEGSPDANVLQICAASYAENGEFDLAVNTLNRALELVQGGGDPALLDELRRELDLYIAKQDYREPP